MASLEYTVGHRPDWGVQINYRISRRVQLLAFAAALLEHGGVAVDDFCGHVWTVAEIKSDVLIKGARFGEGPVR
ncbi:hypothetical protein GSF22_07645 [Micromonospora echinofusca]|uniref:Uncharacterized protein n=1 Tax=Micromonospora echinofusca TaxID=47858 RepID=A0ABS3VNC8_MICEH|nr:hypothetical protein [Micromonospora echinofusca]